MQIQITGQIEDLGCPLDQLADLFYGMYDQIDLLATQEAREGTVEYPLVINVEDGSSHLQCHITWIGVQR